MGEFQKCDCEVYILELADTQNFRPVNFFANLDNDNKIWIAKKILVMNAKIEIARCKTLREIFL